MACGKLISSGNCHFWGVTKNCFISLAFTPIQLRFWIDVEEKTQMLYFSRFYTNPAQILD
jgi:hypothetical protein